MNFSHSPKVTPPQTFLPVLQKVKGAYLQWFECYQILPKSHRYSLGLKIDHLFCETIEAIATAAFLRREEKVAYVRAAIQKIDTVKVLLMILWEAKLLDTKKYSIVSAPLDEIGKMLGGWYGQLQKQNSPVG